MLITFYFEAYMYVVVIAESVISTPHSFKELKWHFTC